MKSVDIKPLLSPEWGMVDQHAVTTQFGATIQFNAHYVKKVQCTFQRSYPGLSFAVKMGDTVWQDVTVDGETLSFAVPDNMTDVAITVMLRTIACDSLTLWSEQVILLGMSVDQGDITPIEINKPFITFVGDSISAGEDMAIDGHHPELSYPYLVATALNKPMSRIAYGGTGLTAHAPFQQPTAIEALWHVAENVARRRVITDLVIVNYGTNDFNYHATADSFAFGLRIYLFELIKRFHTARIILFVPLNGAFKTVFQEEIKRFSQFTLFDASQWLATDERVHPNILEHQQIAEYILKGI